MHFIQERAACNKQAAYNRLTFPPPGFSIIKIFISTGQIRKRQCSSEQFLPFSRLFYDTSCNHIVRWKQNEMIDIRDSIWPCHVYIFNMSTKKGWLSCLQINSKMNIFCRGKGEYTFLTKNRLNFREVISLMQSTSQTIFRAVKRNNERHSSQRSC